MRSLKIKAVVFDLFETLITEVGTAPPRASSLGEPLGLDPRAFRAEWRARRPLVVRGQLSFEQALVEIGMHLDSAVDASAVRRVCDERIRAKAAMFQRIVAKPDPRIYLKATDQLGVEPAEGLYIGDGGDDELIGAKGAGLRAAQAIWFLRHRTDPSGPAPATFPRVSSRLDVLQLVAGN